MIYPLNLGPGLIFDGRSIMISLCALYFGPLAGAVTGAMALLYRIGLGGAGTIMGVLVILSSLGIGLLAYFRFTPATRPLSATHLYLFGLLVHVTMLTMVFSLPGGTGFGVIMRIGLPVMLLYPLATVLAGKILSDQVEADRVMESLRENEEKYRQLFDLESDAIFLIDNETGRILEANAAAAALYGYSHEELCAIKNTDLSAEPEETRKATVSDITRIPVRWHRQKNGTEFPVEITATHLVWKSRPVHIAAIRDITVRMQTEKEHLKLQTQLSQAQKMESVGRLAGGVAHDYNNMLNVILGYTELALDKVGSSEPLHADLTEIHAAARRSADITRQLLAFARKQTIAPKVLDMNETVENMLTMLHRLIGEDIDLVWRPGKNVRPVKIDISQLEQVLANLCVNARDAIAGVGKMTIETNTVIFDDAYCAEYQGFVPGEFVLLAVSDDGCGMDQETLAGIFEPFFTTKDVNQGTGLGLATVYGIVKQNNGFINVYSEPGKGTTFKIYLPCHVGEKEKIKEQVPTETQAGRGEMILLVEDESALREMGQKMLERMGYQVWAAATPAEAIRLAAEHQDEIQLLITDVVMPEMNGRDLADHLHTLYPEIKILFMSGYTADVIAHQGVLDEGVQFIQKPFSMKDLGVKVRAILDYA
ncbi:MAG: response regulator [Desulfocapsa sp.]|nr:response regulator [Desulfocapsa sp.]